MEIKQITTFKDVEIKNKTLVLCDIDETLLTFDPYNYEYFYNTHIKYFKNHTIAHEKAIKDFNSILLNMSPKYTDKEEFLKMTRKIRENNSLLLFLTSRYNDNNNKQLTKNHLKKLGLENYCNSIHHTNGGSKAEYIFININTSFFENIVFIDDLEGNLNDVKRNLPFIQCYQFCKK